MRAEGLLVSPNKEEEGGDPSCHSSWGDAYSVSSRRASRYYLVRQDRHIPVSGAIRVNRFTRQPYLNFRTRSLHP